MQRNTPNLTHAQELVALRTGREPRDLLVQLYVRDGRTMKQIGAELGISRNTVAMWLRELGITRDDRAKAIA